MLEAVVCGGASQAIHVNQYLFGKADIRHSPLSRCLNAISRMLAMRHQDGGFIEYRLWQSTMRVNFGGQNTLLQLLRISFDPAQ